MTRPSFEDAFYAFEIARYKDGKYAYWSHGFTDNHEDYDMEDMDITAYLNGLTKAIRSAFYKYMLENHPDKVFSEEEIRSRFPSATGTCFSVNGERPDETTNVGATMRELSDKELEERFKKKEGK